MTENQTTTHDDIDPADQREAVRERYGAIAEDASDEDCCDSTSDCCTDDATDVGANVDDRSAKLGYTQDDLDAVASGANLGLGCGNPTAIADLEPGKTVLDLGSGAGFDCFLAAQEVGEEGQVIGVDMTPAMVEKARENAADNDLDHVDFRLGEIEHLPVADGTVDVIISNCVINLSPDKPAVFAEARRVLRPGGKLAVSDVVLTAEPPADLRTDLETVAGCVGGAATIPELASMLTDAGFVDVAIEPKADSDEFVREWDDERDLSEYVTAAVIEASNPDA